MIITRENYQKYMLELERLLDDHPKASSPKGKRIDLLATKLESFELRQSLDLIRKADMRAIKMWQKETGKKNMWPDRTEMIFWLLKKVKP